MGLTCGLRYRFPTSCPFSGLGADLAAPNTPPYTTNRNDLNFAHLHICIFAHYFLSL
jgi:hypothetical protein